MVIERRVPAVQLRRWQLTLTLIVLALTLSSACAANDSWLIDFGDFIQTEVGGFFRCFGGTPDQISDRLTTLGKSATPVWHVNVFDDASGDDLGLLIPLFDEHIKTGESLPRMSRGRLQLRLQGELGSRLLHVALVPSKNPEARGVEIGRIGTEQLAPTEFTDISMHLASRQGNKRVGFLRITIPGDGPAWFAIDRIAYTGQRGSRLAGANRLPDSHPLKTALWVWNTPEVLSDESKADSLLEFCQEQEITDLFFQVPYLFEGGKSQLELAKEQQEFIAKASAHAVTIHALDGNAEYALRENHPRMMSLMEAFGAFNADCQPNQGYRSLHLDNEPYLLTGWSSDSQRPAIIRDYIELYEKLRLKADDLNIKLGVDIPFWWDERDEDGVPRFQRISDGTTTPLLESLFPLIDSAGIMSYRNRVTGPNGVIAHCLNEFELAEQFGVELFAAVEFGTGSDVEKGTSLGPHRPEHIQGQMETLRRILSRTPGCAGIAIHYYKPYAQLASKP